MIQRIYSMAEVDGDLVNIDAFMTAIRKLPGGLSAIQPIIVTAIFRGIDVNNDGYADNFELKTYVKANVWQKEGYE